MRPCVHWMVSTAAALAATGGVGQAWGQPAVAAVQLTWQAPAGCPDQATVRARVEQLLAGGAAPPAKLEAHALVRLEGDERWTVHLVTLRDGTSGERTLQSSSCRSLAEATALIVVLTVDPGRTIEAATASPTPTPTPTRTAIATAGPAPAPPSPATAGPTPTRTPTAPTTVRKPWREHWAWMGGVVGDIGTLPQPSLGPVLEGSLLVGPLRVEAYALDLVARHANLSQWPAVGGSFRFAGGGVRACTTFASARFDVAPCAGVEMGDLHGEGFGSEQPAHADGLWIAASAGARAALRIAGWFGMAAGLDAIVPLRRDEFVVDPLGSVHRAAVVEGRLLLGPEVRF